MLTYISVGCRKCMHATKCARQWHLRRAFSGKLTPLRRRCLANVLHDLTFRKQIVCTKALSEQRLAYASPACVAAADKGQTSQQRPPQWRRGLRLPQLSLMGWAVSPPQLSKPLIGLSCQQYQCGNQSTATADVRTQTWGQGAATAGRGALRGWFSIRRQHCRHWLVPEQDRPQFGLAARAS